MEKYAWKATVIEGRLEEYIRRHNEIWDEMLEVLEKAGIVNYTIWNVGNELFGYYECTKGIEFATKVQSESVVVDKWNEYMKDVMVMELDLIMEHLKHLRLVCIFIILLKAILSKCRIKTFF